jgi:hypothetical protein
MADSTSITNGIVYAIPRLVGGKGGKLCAEIFPQILPFHMNVMIPHWMLIWLFETYIFICGYKLCCTS